MERKSQIKFKKAFCILCVLAVLSAIIPSATAADSEAFSTDGTNLSGCVLAAYIPSVGANSENLKTNSLDAGAFNVTASNFSTLKTDTDSLRLRGSVAEIPFDIVAIPYDSPANENVQVFDAGDTLGNFTVLYSDIERNIRGSALYFDDVELDFYTSVLKLYLRPLNSTDFVVIEIFTTSDVADAYLQNPIREDPLAPGRINQLWYTKVFNAPVEQCADAGITPFYVKDSQLTTEFSQLYHHLGHSYKQRFSIKLYVSYPTTFSNKEDFLTGYRVMDARIECIDAPNESSSVSNIEARDLRVDIATDSGTACDGYAITGQTKQGSKAGLKIKFNTTVKINSIVSIALTYSGAKTHQLNETAEFFGGLDYVRQFGYTLNSNDKLTQKSNYVNVDWKIKNYGGSGINKTFKVRFTYTMVNLINGSGWNGEVNTKDITVNFNTTA